MSFGSRLTTLKLSSATSQATLTGVPRLTALSRQFSASSSDMAPVTKHYDYVVIGGGSGGSGAARRASGWYKAKTAMIEVGISGGCCVNVGSAILHLAPSLPSLMTRQMCAKEDDMVRTPPILEDAPLTSIRNFASINETIEKGKHYGYDVQKVPFSFKTFVEKRDARIHTLNGIYEKNWDNDGIDLYHASATFLSDHELEIKPNDGSEPFKINAKHVCIATGSYPTKPQDIKGSEHGISSDEYFLIKHLPKKMVFVGAGYISVELAGVMNAIGVETHMFIRGKTFLRKFDPMVQDLLTQHYEEIGVHIHREHPGIKEVVLLNPGKDESDPREKRMKLIMNDGSEMETNELLWAIGRGAEARDLGIENTTVKRNDSGHIIVDKYQNTSADKVYALGDVTGQAELTPVAIAAGRQLGNRVFGPPEFKDAHLDYERIPTVVFAHPTVGTTGLTQPQAEEKYGKDNIKIYQAKFSGMLYDVFPPEEKKKNPTCFKLICQGPEEKIVGMHILGEGTDEM